MGIVSSTIPDIASPFQKISQWPWTKVLAILREYADGDYDFGIDYSVIMGVTGLDLDDAKTIVSCLCKNDSGIVNSVTFLCVILLLGDNSVRNETARLEQLFAIMDFNNANQISADELTIMLMSISSAIVAILHNVEEMPTDSQLVKLGGSLNESKGRKASSPIYKQEFITFATAYLDSAPNMVATLDVIIQLFNGSISPLSAEKVDETPKKAFE